MWCCQPKLHKHGNQEMKLTKYLDIYRESECAGYQTRWREGDSTVNSSYIVCRAAFIKYRTGWMNHLELAGGGESQASPIIFGWVAKRVQVHNP